MSLCTVLNNPRNFVILSGDGRVTRKHSKEIVSNSQKKIFKINENTMVFISGVQILCNRLIDLMNKEIISTSSTFDEISEFIKRNSLILHEEFCKENPNLLDEDEASLAIIMAFRRDEIFGFLNFCQTRQFSPVESTLSEMNCRGRGEDIIEKYVLEHMQSNHSIEEVIYSGYKEVSKKESSVGGNIYIYILDRNGIRILKEGYV